MAFTFNDPRVPQRIWDKIKVDENDCWVWQGAKTKAVNGYGRVGFDGKVVCVHRLLFSLLVGPIEEILDHVCKNTACCNPAHLRQATRPENNRHRISAEGSSSNFLGVSWCRQHEKWAASARLAGKQRHLGFFLQEEHAALTYDRFVKEYTREFASLNFPDYEGDYSEIKDPRRGPPSSKRRGVSWNKRKNKWKAQVTLNGKQHYLGYFVREEEAARAYDAFVIKHGLPLTRLNFPDGTQH